jgi:hypothetical protein
VKKASEYRRHAAECREMANRASGPQRDQLLEMARTWDVLADNRDKQIARQRRIDTLDRPAE